ncbi:hypothetical protein [Acinetobacter higginsii]|uniref:hypothetical protein n=1 Tax=Acinetobacter higginsii TaxID=70347 RepID=UPI001F4AC4CF|nr:hypothetical protein [Acinetobacter higginsii]MCH7293731.1 hypothetical protein [Acinetobacter higginsii]
MYTFAIVFYLTQSCLGEITPNFRRIYLSVQDGKIKIYFFLEKENVEDITNIQDEIIFYFSNYIDDQPELENYEIIHEIFLGKDRDFKDGSEGDLVQIFHRKE